MSTLLSRTAVRVDFGRRDRESVDPPISKEFSAKYSYGTDEGSLNSAQDSTVDLAVNYLRQKLFAEGQASPQNKNQNAIVSFIYHA